MKRSIVLLSLFFVSHLSAQRYLEYDTIRRNEISASFLPIFTAFSGYQPVGRYGSWNFSYKHYFKNRLVLRTAVVIGHEWNISAYQNPQYDTTVGGVNYFRTTGQHADKKFQFNIGMEKIFRI